MGEHDRLVPPRDRYIDAVFGEGGYLSHEFAGYTPRVGQVALARAVDHAIAERTHLLAEGPTGTGKSLAYAAPASYYAWHTGKPVIICTANIALQEQIVNKDLPLLQRIVPWPFTFALLKGRNNYLCEDRLDTYETELKANRVHHYSSDESGQARVVLDWARTSHDEGAGIATGDVSELPFEPLHTVWKQFSVSSDECKKDHCIYKDRCFANAALEEARQAKVIVTNYHMLFAHLSVFKSSGLDLVLPPFEMVVMDEAHKAADIAREFFGFKITVETVRRLGRRAAKMNPVVGGTVDGGATLLFHAMSGLKNDPKRYKARLTGDYTNEERDAWYQLSSGLTLATKEFSDQVVALTASVNECARRYKDKLDEVFGDVDRLDEKGRAVQRELKDLRKELGNAESDFTRCVSVHSDLGEAMDPKGHLERVYFLEEDEKKRITMSSKYVDVGQVLNEWLFNKVSAWRGPHGEEVRGNRTTVVATSATIATNGTSFDYIAKELGVPNGYHELVAQSPFDWQTQCLFIVPRDMPEPNAPEFRDAVARTIERAILLAGGRTLALFTSRRVLEHTYDVIHGPCARNKINVLKQGQEPRTKLIARFKEDVSSVLLGTESFWAGVDVPGEACSVVIIDRLPFPTPDDPVLDVLSSRDRDWFFRYSVPRAMIAFKQGFGRSVRSSACHKVVICLDARLSTKRYGRDFLRSLPPGLPKSTRLEALVEWLNPPPPEAWDAI